jgi:peptidase M23-like protein
MLGRPLRQRWLALGGPLLLAGLLPLSSDHQDRWCWSGAWNYPVGDPFELGKPAEPGGAGYRAGRSLVGEGGRVHAGADLSNRRSGETVRATAHGVVVAAGRAGRADGYGVRVVVAHRLPDGALAYTVYAHLAEGSIAVRAGAPVYAGDALGRVGSSGRATSPHLHFEVRLPGEPGARWEKAPALDPLRYVAARLPQHRADSTWAGPYLMWAERAGLLGPESDPAPLRRAAWRRMLAAAARGAGTSLESAAEAVRATLERAGVLSGAAPRIASDPGPLTWPEMARDLEALRRHGLCLPPSPVPAEQRGDECLRRLGVDSPERALEALSRADAEPTAALACLALADLAGDPPAARAAATARDPGRN